MGAVSEKIRECRLAFRNAVARKPNDDFTVRECCACGDAIRPMAVDVPDDIDW